MFHMEKCCRNTLIIIIIIIIIKLHKYVANELNILNMT